VIETENFGLSSTDLYVLKTGVLRHTRFP